MGTAAGAAAAPAASVLESIDLKLLQENIQRLFEAVFYAVDDYGRPLRAAFMNLPSQEDLPDYYAVVQHPISLAGVEARKYLSERAFADDMRLLFSNAKTFYPAGSPVYADAECLERVFEAQYRQLHLAVPDPDVPAVPPAAADSSQPAPASLSTAMLYSQELRSQPAPFPLFPPAAPAKAAPAPLVTSTSALAVPAGFDSFPDAATQPPPSLPPPAGTAGAGAGADDDDEDELLAEDLDEEDVAALAMVEDEGEGGDDDDEDDDDDDEDRGAPAPKAAPAAAASASASAAVEPAVPEGEEVEVVEEEGGVVGTDGAVNVPLPPLPPLPSTPRGSAGAP